MSSKMTQKEIDAAKRVLSCKHWQWLPGMLAVAHDESTCLSERFRVNPPSNTEDYIADRIPDLSDPATKGCIAELVRRAWNDPSFYTLPVSIRKDGKAFIAWEFWGYRNGTSSRGMHYESEGLALVEALKCAL